MLAAIRKLLDAKSNTGHTHAIADVTGLQTALDGKATGFGANAWALIEGATGMIKRSQGITSVVRNATANYTVTLSTTFGSVDHYAAIVIPVPNVLGSGRGIGSVTSKTTNSFVAQTGYISSTGGAISVVDDNEVIVLVFGA